MSLNNMGLGFVFTARDLASSKMAGLERRFSSLDERVSSGTKRMTKAFKQLGVGLATFTAGTVAVAGAFSLANAAGKFEQGLAAVGAVTKATTHQLEQLHDAAIDAGIATQFSPEEAVEGLQSLATAGQTAEQATSTLIPVLDLAAGSLGQLGVVQAAEAVVGTLNAYGMSADRAANVTDRLLRITQLTNFQTRDFEAGLAKAAASGSVFGQSLDDVLITMGLLRNRNIDASSSATAFRESVRRIGAESRAQNAVLGAGVDIFDKQSGKMRSIVDIMVDFADATRTMTEEERNRRVATAFGARGLLAFNAILNASFTTMRDGKQLTLYGAEAIAALRKEMGAAGGTAEEFREKLLDTFEGQKTLLQGTMQTFAVALGEPFAAIFKPIVGAVVNALNAMLRAFQAIPGPVKKIIAGVIVGTGALLFLVGGVLAVRGAITLLSIAIKMLGISFRSVMATMLPAILIVGLLAIVVAGFVVAFKKNLGGIADFAKRTWEKIRLFFRALQQLFSQGGFSGAVREELNRAENLGLKRFLSSIWQIVHRIQQAWEGFKAGFVSAVEAARPIFEDFVAALNDLGQELFSLFSELGGGAAGLPSAEFASFGETVGSALGTIVGWAAKVAAVLTRIASGVAAGFHAMFEYVSPAIDVIQEALGQLARAWKVLTGANKENGKATSESTASWKTLGMYLGQVFGFIVTTITMAIGGLIKVLTFTIYALDVVKQAFIATGTWIGETAAGIYLWFTETLPAAIKGAVDMVVGFFRAIGQFFIGIGEWFSELFGSIVDGIASFLSPVVEFFRGVARAIASVFDYIRDLAIKILREIPDELLPESLEKLKRTPLSSERSGDDDGLNFASVQQHIVARGSGAMPAAAESKSRSDDLARLEANALAMARSSAEKRQGQPITVKLEVDGETLAKVTHDANRDNAARSFSAVPQY